MTDDIVRAADALINAFAEGRLDDYFAAFAPDATFLFHTTPDRLTSTAAYRDLWNRWVKEDDFRVLACTSTDRHIQLLGDTAIFTHRVRTDIATTDGPATLDERETIVFHHQNDHWQAIHEHLSPTPKVTRP